MYFFVCRLLHSQTAFFHFCDAEITCRLALEVVDRLQAAGEQMNLAGLFAEFSVLHFSKSEYDEVCCINVHLSF
jgi:hypothetical protein